MITSPNQQEDNALGRFLSLRLPLNRELAVYIAIFLLAVFTRFHMLDDRVMSHDESLHTRFSYNLYKDGNFQHTPLMHGPVLFHATALSFYLFGDSDFSGRIYTALLGVIMVIFPTLLRKWLGRWGAMFAAFLLLISPLLLYYNRYIRHDTPSILFGMIMAYCILMYLDGSPRFRRRAFWLYLFAAAMILNLGSKETAFIYIAIFGSFLLIFFLVRLAQQRYRVRGKPIFNSVVLGILLGGVMTLGMYTVVDVIPVEIVPGRGANWADLTDLERSSWINWMALSALGAVFVLVSTALYAFRDRPRRIPRREVSVILLIAAITAGSLLFIEELSHVAAPAEAVEPSDPFADSSENVAGSQGASIRWAPGLALWLFAIAAAIYLIRDARRATRSGDKLSADKPEGGGLWAFLYQFPEVDFIVLIVTLILPWTTALFVRMMGGSSAAYAGLAESLPDGLYQLLASLPNLGSVGEVGQFLVGAFAFAPLILISIALGLAWNWKRWLVCAAIFHIIFAFFFTSVFTNIAGLGTGMIYSLGYWLEQQGVRRGSQPQYYYLLIILPTYEFLPIIGSVSAMFAGVTCFWKSRRDRIVKGEILRREQADAATETARELASENANADAAQANETNTRDQQTDIDDADELLSQPSGEATDAEADLADEDKLGRLPFLLLLAWWAVLNLVGYSLAGEKMPWLGTHLTTPMILITAWYFGGVLSRVDTTQFRARGWLALLLMPAFVISLAQVLGAFIAGNPPFAGLEQVQLGRTYAWLASLFLTVGLGYLLLRLARLTSWMHIRRLGAAAVFGILSLLTLRAAWMASFINYDLPTELLVYAHAAPAVKWVLDDIEEMSLRMTDGKEMRFAYDDEVSWPYSWYFRDYGDAVFVGGNPTLQNTQDAVFVVVGAGHRGDVEPLLEDHYMRRDHMRMWWPMQEYFNLTPQRIINALDFSPANENAAALRRGIFDIWWSRDYDQYGEATGKDFSLTNWPVSDRMHIYVRKDFASKIWEYGIGDGEVPSNIPTEINQCAANWQQINPILSFDTSVQSLRNPLGMSAAAGYVAIADENANLVHVFTSDGEHIRSLGAGGALAFNRPNSALLLPGGDLLVVDTWNYRILRIGADEAERVAWGAAGEFGFDAPAEPSDGFWGPRDAAVYDTDRVFIADTGNKRIRVYALEGADALYQYDIGSGGSGPGELDEPSGLAIHSDGRLFVADTWNRRIAVFDVSGAHITNFRVRGWYNTTFNRPYLALDEASDMLYVSDPDGRRILVYSTGGDCIGSFAEAGENGALGQFTDIGGIAVDEAGFVYVSDSNAGEVFKFEPFPRGQ
ncbi:MAG: TIGR03663 family protein [Chloroflexota bacterium]|nr:TIGR03663 family protein [Chloroflexota bacterium]MDE2909157.1 TIGR03663 family protein [Chloroflexota bacterium]